MLLESHELQGEKIVKILDTNLHCLLQCYDMPTSTLSGEAERPQVAGAVIEAFESPLPFACLLSWVILIVPRLLIRGPQREKMVDDHEYFVGDGQRSLLLANAYLETPKGTHRRERVTRPGKLYCLFLQGFAHPLISDTFPQVSGTGNSDARVGEKRASQRAFSCTSASAEGKNGNMDFAPAAYRVPSQLPLRRSILRLSDMRGPQGGEVMAGAITRKPEIAISFTK